MTLEVGKKAPQFSLPDKDGIKHSLKDINTKYTLVYFYPKDNTPGCATEAVTFTKLKDKFDKEKITIIGISGGNEKTKSKFCLNNKLTITLLSDEDFKVSTKFGVYGEKKFMGRTYMGINRTSFLLNKDKKIIKVYKKVKPKNHPLEVLLDVKQLK